ncbi:MAG: cysteine desulfurase [Blastocatellia bacterium]|nr:cysteine desulfurase [Blastocatellia bacterium]
MFRRVYLDNAATTPVDPQVVHEMMAFLKEDFGNPSSIHYYGQRARAAVDRARHQAAALINARPNEVVFTSGGTESNNLAIRGLVKASEKYGRHIVLSGIEHPAVASVCDDLETEGFSVTRLPVYDNGLIHVEDVQAAICDETVLVSVMTVNNEIGTIQPIEEIGRHVRTLRAAGRKIWFHTDAVQAIGKVPVDVEEIGCDLLSISGHKIYAPKGIGALYIRRGTRLHSQNIGGRQERGIRGGTESVPNIVALGKAAELAAANLAATAAHLFSLRQHLENAIGERFSGTTLNGDRDLRVPGISNVSFSGVEGEALLINLDMRGIAVSTGSACSSGSLEPSPVIRALGVDEDRARGAIRFSFGQANTLDDVDYLLEALGPAVETLRGLQT